MYIPYTISIADVSTLSLQGYYIRVTNTSSNDSNAWNDNQICYRDPSNETLPEINEHDCHRVGQYVWIVNENATKEDTPYVHLEICEVEIEGCEVNKFGENCTDCGSCNVCDIVKGCTQCGKNFNGSSCEDCLPGYGGENCDKCSEGFYGYNCSENCTGKCTENQTCYHVTGECKCLAGFIGENCTKSCANNTYGQECMYNCSQNCLDGDACHHVNGSCTNGCNNGWKGNQCNESTSDLDRPDKGNFLSNVPAVIGAIISASVLFIIIGLLLLFYKSKRFRQKGPVEDMNQDINYSTLAANHSPTSYENLSNTESFERSDEIINSNTSISFSVAEISKVVAQKSKDNYNIFQSEYKAIPYGEQIGISCTIGKEERHLEKNRFKSVYPYDHSRISLRDTQDDYIHANYIQNVNNEKTYIASQGPKKNTIDDFWAMVYQENVSVIVMLTNLVEGKKKKCEKYWPERGIDALHGQIRVHFVNEKQYANYIIRSFRIYKSQQSDTSRKVTQFHYTQWPDHGVPDPISLVLFHKHVRRALEKANIKWPLLVHCSAGIGRSGTFIALDALHQQGLNTGVINVAEYVSKMREDRMNMVQNVDQYICLHIALLESFQGCSVVMSKAVFVAKVQNIDQQNEESSFWITSQFNELISIKKKIDEDENKAGIDNGELLLKQNVLPIDKYRAVQTPSEDDTVDYYNATLLSTFLENKMLIAAQYPKTKHPIDLIRLLVEHGSSILVFINPMTEIPLCAELLTQQKTDLGPYTVQQEETLRISVNLRRSKMKIRNNEQTEWMAVNVYELLSWTILDLLPSDLRALSDVIKYIRMDVSKGSEHTPITVLSKDGATGCGIFCAVYNAIQQLQQDNEVDIFTIVRQLQRRKAEMISSLKEYRACHEVTLLCLQDIELEQQQDDYNATDKDYVNM
ncbi:receptor-type tyrosine-protein phosphatase alpha-like [Saccostrea echinata]|uniref:receptor-type tyrosine-protein phosphatase alpha-like n=1 Tax=Saccostrea echinata TaxID=191078 RepID=UPI002A81A3E9|nr:receptor-type tyrosine-protein phosphatase alpha-like [Saccostrea echinata]